MKTGQGLKEYAIAQLGKPYWWGTFGQRADGALSNLLLDVGGVRKRFLVLIDSGGLRKNFRAIFK